MSFHWQQILITLTIYIICVLTVKWKWFMESAKTFILKFAESIIEGRGLISPVAFCRWFVFVPSHSLLVLKTSALSLRIRFVLKPGSFQLFCGWDLVPVLESAFGSGATVPFLQQACSRSGFKLIQVRFGSGLGRVSHLVFRLHPPVVFSCQISLVLRSVQRLVFGFAQDWFPPQRLSHCRSPTQHPNARTK